MVRNPGKEKVNIQAGVHRLPASMTAMTVAQNICRPQCHNRISKLDTLHLVSMNVLNDQLP